MHDAGDEAGVLWFSMDYLPGGNLARRGEQPLPAREASRLVGLIAEAVQFAHDHGVLHRDLKPSNILLGDDGRPHITDFGIARLFADCAPGADFTRTGQPLGSPGYMAPEQALEGRASPRTDVYGLGALLYFLLAGRPPFHGPTPEAVLLQLREHDPVPPRRLVPTVPRDLETICLHALRKEPERRYASAREMADDLARFGRDEPIRARPPSLLAHAKRWLRRHPGSAALLLLTALLALALAAGAALFLHRQTQLMRRAELLAAAQFQPIGQVGGARTRALAALREAWRIAPSDEIRNEAIAWLSLPEITFETTTLPTPPPADPAANFRDGLLVTGGEDRFLSVRDATDGSLRHRLSGHDAPPDAIAFRHGGQEFASAAADGHVRLWHATRGVEVLQFDGTPRHRAPLWWSPDDARLFCPRADGGGVDVYRVDWPRAVQVLAPPAEEPHTENLRTFALSPDGRLAAAVDEKVTRVWDLAAARLLLAIPKVRGEWMSVEFAPDGAALWLCGFNSGLRRLPIRRDGELATLPIPGGALLAGISADGRRLALSQNTDGAWLLVTPPDSVTALPQRAPFQLAFAPDGRTLATASLGDAELLLWTLPAGRIAARRTLPSPVEWLEFTADGRALWIVMERAVQRWDVRSLKPEFAIDSAGLRGLTFSADGKLAASYEGNVIRLLRADRLTEIARLTPPPAVGWLGAATLRFDAAARHLAAHTALGVVVVWDLAALRADLRTLGMDWSDAKR